jgi:glycosyltransferase involved in cell wall biosynthesis
MAKPVVASKVGGLIETVEDGKTGFLVEPRQPQALAEAINRLLREPALQRQMGQQARLRVEDRFSREQMIINTENLYWDALERKGLL